MGVIKESLTFDDVTLVPQYSSVLPYEAITSIELGKNLKLDIPIIGSAMDSVVSPKTAGLLGNMGALGVLNLEGIQTRYENPDTILDDIARSCNASWQCFRYITFILY